MRHTIVGTLVLLAGAGTIGTASTRNGESHVRTDQQQARALLATAVDRSETIRYLINRVEASDVVAYVVLKPFLKVPTSTTTLVSAAGGFRYVLVSLNERNSGDDMIVLLGHELQHVLEIAEAAEVVDARSFDRFYARIGSRWGDDLYETEAALAVGRRVRQDLAAALTN